MSNNTPTIEIDNTVPDIFQSTIVRRLCKECYHAYNKEGKAVRLSNLKERLNENITFSIDSSDNLDLILIQKKIKQIKLENLRLQLSIIRAQHKLEQLGLDPKTEYDDDSEEDSDAC